MCGLPSLPPTFPDISVGVGVPFHSSSPVLCLCSFSFSFVVLFETGYSCDVVQAGQDGLKLMTSNQPCPPKCWDDRRGHLSGSFLVACLTF